MRYGLARAPATPRPRDDTTFRLATRPNLVPRVVGLKKNSISSGRLHYRGLLSDEMKRHEHLVAVSNYVAEEHNAVDTRKVMVIVTISGEMENFALSTRALLALADEPNHDSGVKRSKWRDV